MTTVSKTTDASRLKVCIGAVLVCLSCLAMAGCEPTVHVTDQMTWKCAPEVYKAGYYTNPNEYVRFRFVDKANYFAVVPSKNFCSELQKTGKPVVSVSSNYGVSPIVCAVIA